MQLTNLLTALPLLALAAAAPSYTPPTGNAPQCIYPAPRPFPPIRRMHDYKVSIPIYKTENVTTEFFHAYWDACSIPLAENCPDFVKNVERFVATHNTPELRAQFTAAGFPTLDYDGIIEFTVKDFDHFKAAVTSECWTNVRRDAATFSKFGEYKFMYGYETIAHDRTLGGLLGRDE